MWYGEQKIGMKAPIMRCGHGRLPANQRRAVGAYLTTPPTVITTFFTAPALTSGPTWQGTLQKRSKRITRVEKGWDLHVIICSNTIYAESSANIRLPSWWGGVDTVLTFAWFNPIFSYSKHSKRRVLVLFEDNQIYFKHLTHSTWIKKNQTRWRWCQPQWTCSLRMMSSQFKWWAIHNNTTYVLGPRLSNACVDQPPIWEDKIIYKRHEICLWLNVFFLYIFQFKVYK